MIPAPSDGSPRAFDYAESLMRQYMTSRNIVTWHKYLYNSKKERNGIQYKAVGQKGTINIFLPAGQFMSQESLREPCVSFFYHTLMLL